MSKKKAEDATVLAICLDSFVLRLGEQVDQGDIGEMSQDDFQRLAGMGRVREATADDEKAAKANKKPAEK